MASNSVRINIKNENSVKTPRRGRTRGSIHDCARCRGTGTIFNILYGDRDCTTCKGKGKVRV